MALCFHVTRQRLAWLLRGPYKNIFDTTEAARLELMETKVGFKMLFSRKVRWWYISNRIAFVAGIYFFCWAAAYLWFIKT